MNRFLHRVVDKYHSLNWENSLRVLSESHLLIYEARAFAQNGANKESFHNKFVVFLESFINSSKVISDVYFHLRNNPGDNTWVRISNNTNIKIPTTNKLAQIADMNEFFIVNEDFTALDKINDLKLKGLKKQGVLFQMMDYCDYLIVFSKNTLRTHKLIRFLELLILRNKN